MVCSGSENCSTCALDCGGCCTDTDGGDNKNVKGTIQYYDYGRGLVIETDICMKDRSNMTPDNPYYNYVFEYYCTSSGFGAGGARMCDYGCSNGACYASPATCSDTDGGQVPRIRGTVSGVYVNATNFSFTDTCSGTYYVTEYYCLNLTPRNYQYNCLENFTNGTKSCSNGACI
jgi:hypothetical protein